VQVSKTPILEWRYDTVGAREAKSIVKIRCIKKDDDFKCEPPATETHMLALLATTTNKVTPPVRD